MMRPQKLAVTYIRSFRNFNDQDFCMEMQHSCRKLIGASQTVHEKVGTLISILSTAMDMHMPIEKLSRKQNRLHPRP